MTYIVIVNGVSHRIKGASWDTHPIIFGKGIRLIIRGYPGPGESLGKKVGVFDHWDSIHEEIENNGLYSLRHRGVKHGDGDAETNVS